MSIILCIDLEATCGENWPLEAMECIDLGVVAIDGEGIEVTRFNSLIKPQFTEITNFCTSINNITPESVLCAFALDEVIHELDLWLNELPTCPIVWYSWGDCDAKQWTQDLARLKIADPLPKHLNVKKFFQKQFMKKGRQVGMAKALDLVGLEYQGQRHRALDDAYNLSRLFPYFKQKYDPKILREVQE